MIVCVDVIDLSLYMIYDIYATKLQSDQSACLSLGFENLRSDLRTSGVRFVQTLDTVAGRRGAYAVEHVLATSLNTLLDVSSTVSARQSSVFNLLSAAKGQLVLGFKKGEPQCMGGYNSLNLGIFACLAAELLQVCLPPVTEDVFLFFQKNTGIDLASFSTIATDYMTMQ